MLPPKSQKLLNEPNMNCTPTALTPLSYHSAFNINKKIKRNCKLLAPYGGKARTELTISTTKNEIKNSQCGYL